MFFLILLPLLQILIVHQQVNIMYYFPTPSLINALAFSPVKKLVGELEWHSPKLLIHNLYPNPTSYCPLAKLVIGRAGSS